MSDGKTVLITGSTDGIGLLTARWLLEAGCEVILHGRSQAKLDAALTDLGSDRVSGCLADLSTLAGAKQLAADVLASGTLLDVLINNAGVLSAPQAQTTDGLDVRFAVNTLAPYILTKRLMNLLGPEGRVINVSSAAQSPVSLAALSDPPSLPDMAAYAQSKLALIQWTNALARQPKSQRPMLVSVNPGSLLGTKMVKEGFNMAGKDVGIGAQVLAELALTISPEDADGAYYDNDIGRFGTPHPHALDDNLITRVCEKVHLLAAL